MDAGFGIFFIIVPVIIVLGFGAVIALVIYNAVRAANDPAYRQQLQQQQTLRRRHMGTDSTWLNDPGNPANPASPLNPGNPANPNFPGNTGTGL